MKATLTTCYIRIGLIVAAAVPLATTLGWYRGS